MTKCTFCGLGACENCTKKKHYYPQSEMKNGIHESRGTICKLCDRKFFIYKMVEATRKEIEANQASIKAIESNKKRDKIQFKADRDAQDE